VVRDLRMWTGVKIEKTFAKDWRISLEEEVRLRHNVSEVGKYFTELGIRYRINKNFALGGAFRFTRDRNNAEGFDNMGRYHLDLRYRGRVDFLTLYYRLRYQREADGLNMFDMSVRNEKLFRNRIGLKVNSLDWVEPFVTAEVFQEISPYVAPQFISWRFVAGAAFEPGNFGEIKAGWGFNRELGALQPAMDYLIRINYTYSF